MRGPLHTSEHAHIVEHCIGLLHDVYPKMYMLYCRLYCNPYCPFNNSGMMDIIDIRPLTAADRHPDNVRLYARSGMLVSGRRVGKGRHKVKSCLILYIREQLVQRTFSAESVYLRNVP